MSKVYNLCEAWHLLQCAVKSSVHTTTLHIMHMICLSKYTHIYILMFVDIKVEIGQQIGASFGDGSAYNDTRSLAAWCWLTGLRLNPYQLANLIKSTCTCRQDLVRQLIWGQHFHIIAFLATKPIVPEKHSRLLHHLYWKTARYTSTCMHLDK